LQPPAVGKTAEISKLDIRPRDAARSATPNAGNLASALMSNASRLALATIAPVAWFSQRSAGTSQAPRVYGPPPGASASRAIARPSAAVRAAASYDNDERSAVLLMMVPFFVIALSLGISQTVKPFISNLPTPGMAARAPVNFPSAQPATVGVLHPLAMPAPPVFDPAGNQADLAAQRLAAWTPPQIPWARDLSPPLVEATPLPVSTAPLPRPQLPPAIIAPPAPVMTLPDAPPVVAPPEIAAPLSPDPPRVCERVASPPLPVMGRATVPPQAVGAAIAAAAYEQTKDLVIYSATYRRIGFPMGDLPSLYGACSDVIIRAYRTIGLDLQELVQRARSVRGDSNIDHRRTETLRKFFARYGESITPTAFPEDYRPGDIVTYHRPFSRVSRAHIAIVSDVRAPTGRFMIAHNRGWGPQLEDALFVDRITGHYRFDGTRLPPTALGAMAAAASAVDGQSARPSANALPAFLRHHRFAPGRLSRAPMLAPTPP
jgi:uncharacterized protein YijF (DUF1287 family)